MRDVRDRDQQPETRAASDVHRLAVDGVVEVAGVLAVDRDERHVAQVHPMTDVRGPHFVRQLRCGGERRVAELVRHAVLAHRDFDFHARVVDIADHFDHAAERLRMTAREIGELDRHHLPDLRLLRVLRDEDVVADALVFRHEDQRAVLVDEPADDALVRAVRDLDDMPFRPPAPVIADDAREHAVVVHHLLHFAVGQEQVVLAVVANQEAEAVAMALHAARDEIGRMSELIMAALVEPDLPVALHGAQSLEKSFALLALDRQSLGDVVCSERCFARAQHAENFFAARYRIGIFAQGLIDDFFSLDWTSRWDSQRPSGLCLRVILTPAIEATRGLQTGRARPRARSSAESQNA